MLNVRDGYWSWTTRMSFVDKVFLVLCDTSVKRVLKEFYDLISSTPPLIKMNSSKKEEEKEEEKKKKKKKKTQYTE